MKSAYPLFPICLLVILLYTLSFIFVQMGLLSRVNHRKFWNILLLLAFLAAGLIGLLMVVKINYKLTIPFYEELLGYHVDFGIAMVIIGFIHLGWHLSYYLNLFKVEKHQRQEVQDPLQNDLNIADLRISAFLLGSTSMIAQIILLREFLSVFDGNELVIGLVLANWMILTGIGAWLGIHPLRVKKASMVIFPGLLILSIFPFIITVLINYLKNKIFPIEAMIDLFQIFFTSFMFLIPFCLLSGFLFTYISHSYSELKKANAISPVYGFESAGSIIGGLLSGLIFIFVFPSVGSLLVLILINGFSIFLISRSKGFSGMALVTTLVLLPAIILLFFHPEKRIRSWVYPNQKIEVSKDSPYGNIVVTTRANMRSIYNNNILLYDSENFMINEEAIHFAMVHHPKPLNILLVSGDLRGQIGELIKYKPVAVDCIEENRWLMALIKDSLNSLLSKVVRLTSTDPVRFIRKSHDPYDIVILNLPAPSSLQSNRFYTVEFLSLLKQNIAPDAVLSFGLPAPINYMNKEALELTSTICATLQRVFKNVIIIPGEKNYFTASDNPLTYNIIKTIGERGIENRYVNSDYFNDDLLKSRGEAILSSINPEAKINQNLKPVLYQQALGYWLSHFKGKYWMLAFSSGLIALFLFISGNTASKTMFLTGFSATGLEILLLLGLQIYFGTIYLLTSFVFSGFMAGLTIGAIGGKNLSRFSISKYLFYNQLLIGILAAGTAFLLFVPSVLNIVPVLLFLIYLVAIILTGMLTGFQFSMASLSQGGNYARISGKTYSYDLFGSALGALLLTLFLIPKFGIVTTAIFVCFLNLLSGIFLTLRKD